MDVELPKALELEVFNIRNEKDFGEIALRVYHFQFDNNTLYRDYCTVLKRTPQSVKHWLQIPFLPISFFKSHSVQTTDFIPEAVFESSGTTGANTSRHFVKNIELYEKSFLQAFAQNFGDPAGRCIIGLLPSYLERGRSSLVHMVNRLIERSGHPSSGFYLYEFEALAGVLQKLEAEEQEPVLFGVSFALLDFSQQFQLSLQKTRVIETGGMKGRGREIVREELNDVLRTRLGLKDVFSEYGMTELLSQAYGRNGRFTTPSWMKLLLRDPADPLAVLDQGVSATGAVNVIDLANLYSCSFISTSDLGRSHTDGSFEILGRMDGADMRGCSQLVI